MDDEMYEYDFELFKKHKDPTIDKSRLASKPAKIDIFTEFEELDTFEIEKEDLEFEESLVNNYQDLTEEKEDKMENTLEISNFQDEILNKIDDMQKEEEKKEKMTLESAFIYCSILGFITMIFGYEWFFYIMHSIQ